MSKNLVKTVHLWCEKRVNTRPKRGEGLQNIRGSRNTRGCIGHQQLSPSGQLISRVVRYSGRNECPGTYCSLIVQENESAVPTKEFEVKEKTEERTGWQRQSESRREVDEKKNGRLVGAAKTSKELAEWRRFQRKNVIKLGLPKRKGWPQCHKVSS